MSYNESDYDIFQIDPCYRKEIKNIHFGLHLWKWITTVCMAILMPIFEIYVIYSCITGPISSNPFFMIYSILFLSFILLGSAYLCIRKCMRATKNLSKTLKQYGKNTIMFSLNNATQFICKLSPTTKVFFTDLFIVDPEQAIISYQNIQSVKNYIIMTRTGQTNTFFFTLYSGEQYLLCNGIQDNDMKTVFSICKNYNENIVILEPEETTTFFTIKY